MTPYNEILFKFYYLAFELKSCNEKSGKTVVYKEENRY